MSMLIEVNRGPRGEPGELVDARAYITDLQSRLNVAETRATQLQDVFQAAQRLIGASADGYEALVNLELHHSLDSNQRMQQLVDAVHAYERETRR